MCIICETKDISTLVNLRRLDCYNCPLLTSIPNTLVNLINISCIGCPLLTSIPNTLVNLRTLYCDNCPLLSCIQSTFVNLIYLRCVKCPLLTSIPDTLINLTHLICTNCPLLTSIPDTFINLIELHCNGNRLITSIPYISTGYNYYYDCPWINNNKTRNIQKLITLQRFVKKNLKYWRFSRWIKSREFNEWIYHPDNIGGKMAKREIEKMFN
jgi:hypothetical protein